MVKYGDAVRIVNSLIHSTCIFHVTNEQTKLADEPFRAVYFDPSKAKQREHHKKEG